MNISEDIQIAEKNAALYGLVHKNYLEAEQALDAEVEQEVQQQPHPLYQEIEIPGEDDLLVNGNARFN